MKSISHYCLPLAVFSVFALVACQKEADADLDPPPPAPVTFDSTELVKRVEVSLHDANNVLIEYLSESYAYDTVNRKITVTYLDTFGILVDTATSVYSYNSQGYLTNIKYLSPYFAENFVQLAPASERYYSSIDISYDNANVLKKVDIHYFGGDSRTENFTKTASGAGYALDWHSRYNEHDEKILQWDMHQSNIFDAEGKCIKYQLHNFGDSYSGHHFDGIQYKDSLIYGPTGELTRAYRYDLLSGLPDYYLNWEIDSRYSKGDQLAKQTHLLLKGIENLRMDERDDFRVSSILASTQLSVWGDLYINFPLKTGKFSDEGAALYPITFNATFDNLDRLVTLGDSGAVLWKLTYYK